jgi:hypothetical protein
MLKAIAGIISYVLLSLAVGGISSLIYYKLLREPCVSLACSYGDILGAFIAFCVAFLVTLGLSLASLFMAPSTNMEYKRPNRNVRRRQRRHENAKGRQ